MLRDDAHWHEALTSINGVWLIVRESGNSYEVWSYAAMKWRTVGSVPTLWQSDSLDLPMTDTQSEKSQSVADGSICGLTGLQPC
jgi:hypothetical protein